MENVKAILLTNTAAVSEEVPVMEFMRAQYTVNEPMVIFYDKKTESPMESFKIVAESIEELESMYRMKVFYTSSIPDGSVEKYHGAIFWGVDPEYKEKERTAATVRPKKLIG